MEMDYLVFPLPRYLLKTPVVDLLELAPNGGHNRVQRLKTRWSGAPNGFTHYGLPSAALGCQDDVDDAGGRLVGELAPNGGHNRVQRPRKPPEPHVHPLWPLNGPSGAVKKVGPAPESNSTRLGSPSEALTTRPCLPDLVIPSLSWMGLFRGGFSVTTKQI